MTTTAELTTVPQLDKDLQQIEAMSAQYLQTISNPDIGRLAKTLCTANNIQIMRNLLTPKRMEIFMGLMNSPLGFRTDKKGKDSYAMEEVREVLIAALLNGVFPYGNEFNIIASNLYVTKEGFERKVRETDGLTDLEVIAGVPRLYEGRTIVRMAARWRLHGVIQELSSIDGKPGREFPIKVNQGMGDDGIIGKATRKLLKAVWVQIHGSEQSLLADGEIEEPAQIADKQGELPLGKGKAS